MSKVISFRVEDDMYNIIHNNSNGNISKYMRNLISSQNRSAKIHPQHICRVENILNEVQHKGEVTAKIRKEINDLWRILNS